MLSTISRTETAWASKPLVAPREGHDPTCWTQPAPAPLSPGTQECASSQAASYSQWQPCVEYSGKTTIRSRDGGNS